MWHRRSGLLPLLMGFSSLLSFLLHHQQQSFHSSNNSNHGYNQLWLQHQANLHETFFHSTASLDDSNLLLSGQSSSENNTHASRPSTGAKTSSTTSPATTVCTTNTTELPSDCPKDTKPFVNVLLKPDGQDHCRNPISHILASALSRNVTDLYDNSSTDESIPKVVYFISASNCFTESYQRNLNLWVKALTDHSVVIVNETVANHLLFDHDWSNDFSGLSRLLPCLPHQGQRSSTAKANLVRYLLLWKFGGMYMDIDNAPGLEWHRAMLPFDNPTQSVALVLNKLGRPMNSFLRFPPRHPLMYAAMQIAMANLERVQNVAKYSPYEVTGTDVLGMAFLDFAGLVPWSTALNATEILLSPLSIEPGVYAWNASSFLTNHVKTRPAFQQGHKNWTVTILPADDKVLQTSVIIGHDKRVLYRKLGMTIWQRRRGDGRKPESCQTFSRRVGGT